ncbi:MAG: hypothetical protein JWQ42_2542 [Edaphobacter sp.]|nr:hypothetical protein [Edaphobacter sp.]
MALRPIPSDEEGGCEYGDDKPVTSQVNKEQGLCERKRRSSGQHHIVAFYGRCGCCNAESAKDFIAC